MIAFEALPLDPLLGLGEVAPDERVGVEQPLRNRRELGVVRDMEHRPARARSKRLPPALEDAVVVQCPDPLDVAHRGFEPGARFRHRGEVAGDAGVRCEPRAGGVEHMVGVGPPLSMAGRLPGLRVQVPPTEPGPAPPVRLHPADEAGDGLFAGAVRRTAEAAGWLDVATPLHGDPELGAHLGSVRTPPAVTSLAEPHRERITRWWRQGVQGTTIHGALVRSHGFLEEPNLEVMFMLRKVRDAVLASTGGSQEPFWYGSLSSKGVYLAAGPEPEPSPVAQPPIAETPRVTATNHREDRYWDSVI